MFFRILGKKTKERIKKIVGFLLILIFIILLYQIYKPKIQSDFTTPQITYEKFDRELDAQIYFNEIGDGQVFEELILGAVEQATQSIDVAIYSINYPKLVELLEMKHREGVEVRVIVPYSNYAQHFGVFFNSEFEIKTLGKDDDNFMHHKFLIADNEKIISGSANFTNIQFKYDPGYILETSDSEIVHSFREEFEMLWQGRFGYRKLFNKEYTPLAMSSEYQNGFFELWMSPGYRMNSVKYRKLDLIEQAQSSIKILGWRINDTKILSALNKKIKDGVEVEVLADDYYFYSEHSIVDNLLDIQRKSDFPINIHSDSFLNLVFEFGLLPIDETLDDDFNSFLHQHAMIIDDEILISGTNNWGFNGFYANDENVFVTDIKSLVSDFSDYYNGLKLKIAGTTIDYSIDESTIIFNQIPENLELIAYLEYSFPKKRGEICERIRLINNQANISNECLQKNTRLFLVDEQNNLYSAFYPKID
jgi:phosphatidylserine/phosphatidylglycerophosphate/cardiolipin synthase-like enzyme